MVVVMQRNAVLLAVKFESTFLESEARGVYVTLNQHSRLLPWWGVLDFYSRGRSSGRSNNFNWRSKFKKPLIEDELTFFRS